MLCDSSLTCFWLSANPTTLVSIWRTELTWTGLEHIMKVPTPTWLLLSKIFTLLTHNSSCVRTVHPLLHIVCKTCSICGDTIGQLITRILDKNGVLVSDERSLNRIIRCHFPSERKNHTFWGFSVFFEKPRDNQRMSLPGRLFWTFLRGCAAILAAQMDQKFDASYHVFSKLDSAKTLKTSR